MAIKVQNTPVISDERHLDNIPNIRTIQGVSLLGEGDLGVVLDLTVIKSIHGQSITGDGNILLTPTDIGLGNVDNTSDADKPVSTATQTALNLKADATTVSTHVNDAFNPHGVTATQIGLGNVTNESKTTMFTSPAFTGTPTAPTAVSGTNTTQIASTEFVRTEITNLINSAPGTLDTLNELALALGEDPNFATTVTDSIALKAPLASPTFTGTVSGITKDMVGLDQVDNTSDADKPVSSATQSALDNKVNGLEFTKHINALWGEFSQYATLASPTFTGTVEGITKDMVGLDQVDNTSDADKPVSSATQSALDNKVNGLEFTKHINALWGEFSQYATLASPTFTGTVEGITKDMVGLDQVDNTSDADKPVSTATQTALDGKANSTHAHAISDVTNLQTSLDAKQPNLTGAATTIASNNLTASRAVVSDASGKVAVSSATSTEIGYLSGVTSAIQTQLDGKQATLTGATSNITTTNLTTSRVLVSDASGKVAVSAVNSTEIGYLSGVTSAIQTQLDAKQATLTGATSNITTTNLTASRVLVSDASGKVTASSTGSTNISHIDKLSATSVDIGSMWSIEEIDGSIYFKANGVNKAKLDSSGSFSVTGDVTAYETL